MHSYFSAKFADPFKSHLSLGNIERLKHSSEIILRLKTEDKLPNLLRQAGYETFSRNTWHSSQKFDYLPVDNLSWQLLPPPPRLGTQVKIEYLLPKEKGLLPYPYGSYKVSGDTLFKLEQKTDGTVRIIEGAKLISYDIHFNPTWSSTTDLPTSRNLTIPLEEEMVLNKISAQLQTDSLNPYSSVEKVKDFFRKDFTYSLDKLKKNDQKSPLESFLLDTKSGYCEMFATATTLLLRKVGIPSRYVTGFAVSERSDMVDKYIIRARHAHAWSEAFIDGKWIIVDTTPSDWLSQESKNRSKFEWLEDIRSYLKFHYEYFKIGAGKDYRIVLSGVIIVLSIFLVFRIYNRMKAKKMEISSPEKIKLFRKTSSPFYAIEEKLLTFGIARKTGEPFADWLARIDEIHKVDKDTLQEMFVLHCKLRFDPNGIDPNEKQRLDQLVNSWLTAI